jgi:NADPH-dependent glutamate synthase beta subunit-like oxidoreductase/Pyruvate/2-oxoacid:ferredoxin oxidoreductase delta subunit
MERFLGDWAIKNGIAFEPLTEEAHGESIGVIGAGPSGLSFAYQMARRGYPVTVYEKSSEPGGMLRYGVPDYRLPPSVLNAEIARILELGVELHTGVEVGVDIPMDELRIRHEILYLGIGAQAGRLLGLPGEEGPGVFTGIEYLGRVNRGESVTVGPRVVVIGGGNTAIDAARMARRAGSQVTITYRRTRAEMPAVESEIDQALEEGVSIDFLVAPVRVNRDNGDVSSLTVLRMGLGEPEPDGRRRPVPIPDSEFSIGADTVISAVSQEPDPATLDRVGVGAAGLGVPHNGELAPGLLGGGDLFGPGIAGKAITQGRSAATAVHARLRGLPEPIEDEHRMITPTEVALDSKAPIDAAVAGHRSVAEALAEPTIEVLDTLNEEQFLAEAERCFSCGLCMGCQACWMYCTVGSFTRVAGSSPGNYFALNLNACEECGKCVEVCPCGYLEALV